jgi:hypothetical protein
MGLNMTISVVAYRGEHGKKELTGSFQSRLASFSFGSLKTAKTYATSPNNLSDRPIDPRVYKVHLALENPVINEPSDQFIEFADILKALGPDKALQIAREQEDHLCNTDNYGGLLDEFNSKDINELHKAMGDSFFGRLYVDAYPVFDNKNYVKWFKEAGFDGAVHGGSGTSSMEAEYKVFDTKNVRVLREFDLGAKPKMTPSSMAM